MIWVRNTLVAVVFFVGGILSLKTANKLYSGQSIGFTGNIVFSLTLGTLALLTLPWSFTSLKEYDWSILMFLAFFGLCFFAGNSFFFLSLNQAPNPGYSRALMTLEVVILAVTSSLLFQDPLNWRQFSGILLTLVGVLLVST